MFYLFFLSLIFTLPQAKAETQVELSPVLISNSEELSQRPRSIQWPVQSSKPKSIIQLPQMDEALNSLNGIQTRSQGSPTFSIRGSAQSGRTLLLYNDVPLNFSSGFGAPQLFLPKEVVENVVVIKGPASLFYGSQALAGSLNFQARKYKRPELVTTIADTDESFLPWRDGKVAYTSLQLATPLYQTNKTHIQASFFSEGDDGQFPYQIEGTEGVRNFNASNLSRLVFSANHNWKDFNISFDSIVGRQIRQSPGPIDFSLPTREHTEGLLMSLTPQWFLTERMSLKSRLSYMNTDSSFLDSSGQSLSHQISFISQNEWTYDISSHSQLQFFVDTFSHSLDNSFAGNDLNQDLIEYGPYYSFSLFENFIHKIGARYLQNSDALLPTVSTSYLFENSETWLTYSEGFRNPSLTDLYANSPFFVGNVNLKPEESKQWEWGLRKKQTPSSVTGQWDYEFRLFHIQYKNFIESQQLSPGVFTRVNEGQGYSAGLDADLSWSQANFSSYLRYNYLKTKNQATGEAFRLSPEHQITIGAAYSIANTNLEVQNTHWYNTYDRLNNQIQKLEDWQQWNFFVSFKILENLKTQIGLVNAFNEAKQLTLNYPEPQRKYWLQLRYTGNFL